LRQASLPEQYRMRGFHNFPTSKTDRHAPLGR
jgi:hypothetical protein